MSMDRINFQTKYFDRNQFILLFPILIAAGKIVRFTIMKALLVDTSTGWDFLPQILNGAWSFKLGGVEDSVAGNANDNAIAVYKMLNVLLQTDSFYVFELVITLIFNLIVIAVILKMQRKIPFYKGIYLMLFIIVLNLFDFTLAKEPIQMLFFLLLFKVLISEKKSDRKKVFWCTCILLLSAFSFRAYYLFVLFFAGVCYGLFKWLRVGKMKGKIRRVLIVLAVVFASVSAMLFVMRIFSYTNYAYLLRIRTKENRIGSASQINVLFEGSSSNPYIYAADILVLCVRMLFPIELIRLGPKYIPYVGFQIMITHYYLRALVTKYRSANASELIAICIYTGFLVASSTFEPDFGSWVRHEAVVFPVIMLFSNVFPSVQSKSYFPIEAESENV